MTAKTESVAVGRSIPWGRIFLWAFVIVGVSAGGYRMLHGLGAATNLSDGRPWGLWISFDVLCGVALAAGGFTIGAIVKIFHIKKFYPILRPTVLTAFLGYAMAAGSIVFDIGIPWRIWHPIVYHNWHSPMLEVALCVMTYLTVLALEVSDVFFEGMGWKSLKRIIEGLMIPLVILGITLSTMHQSSLGTLYVLASKRVFALWKTGYLPLLFFTSALVAGLTMTILESNWAASAYGHKVDQKLLGDLGLYAAWVLLIYLVLKIATLIGSGGVRYLFSGGLDSVLYWIEVLGGVVLPMVLLFMPSIRKSRKALYRTAWIAVLGVVLNRFDVSFFGFAGAPYVPTWMEWAITIGIISAAILFYDWFVRHFPVFEHEHV